MFENINKDFNYGSIDEAMGVPDPDRVEELINKIMDRIDLETHDYIYKNGHKGSFSDFNGSIDGAFFLDGDFHCCPWLGDDTLFTYKCDLNSKIFHKSAKFYPIVNVGDVYVLENGSRIIRNGEIDIEFGFGTDFKLNDKDEVERRRNEIKVLLRHELEHVYGELMKKENFPVTYEDQDIKDEIVTLSNVMKGYKVVSNILSKKTYESDDEKKLLEAMYLINYLEINANVAGFYQRLIGAYDMTGSIGSIDGYYEYRVYKESSDFIACFDNQELFDQYKEVIKCMYGKSVTGINKMKNRMKVKTDRFFSKVLKLYNNLNKVILGNSDHIDVRVHDKVMKEYYETKMALRGFSVDSADNNERMVSECLATCYFNTIADSYLSLLDIWFGHIGKPRFV